MALHVTRTLEASDASASFIVVGTLRVPCSAATARGACLLRYKPAPYARVPESARPFRQRWRPLLLGLKTEGNVDHVVAMFGAVPGDGDPFVVVMDPWYQ